MVKAGVKEALKSKNILNEQAIWRFLVEKFGQTEKKHYLCTRFNDGPFVYRLGREIFIL